MKGADGRLMEYEAFDCFTGLVSPCPIAYTPLASSGLHDRISRTSVESNSFVLATFRHMGCAVASIIDANGMSKTVVHVGYWRHRSII